MNISVTEPSPKVAVILVVEDQPVQRLDMLDLVEDAGFEAAEAWDADGAMAILEARDDIRVVFTDVDMPGTVDGLGLAAAIRHRWPPMEIIVTTAGRSPRAELLPDRAMFLPKPLVAGNAIRAMRLLVAAGRA